MQKLNWLWALFALQAFCAVFFIWDAAVDWFGFPLGPGLTESDTFEYAIAIALAASVAFTWRQIRAMSQRQKRLEDQLMIASGEFAKLLENHFEDWSLSPSERDVALLAIKGLSISEIAELRSTRDGTVKAQCNAIYRKAGVSGRQQLLSLFIEELVAGAGEPSPA